MGLLAALKTCDAGLIEKWSYYITKVPHSDFGIQLQSLMQVCYLAWFSTTGDICSEELWKEIDPQCWFGTLGNWYQCCVWRKIRNVIFEIFLSYLEKHNLAVQHSSILQRAGDAGLWGVFQWTASTALSRDLVRCYICLMTHIECWSGPIRNVFFSITQCFVLAS